jgi:hypothetical protein
MAYTIDVSKVLAEVLQRFATLNPHQLAGQAANLDFWLAEIQHSTRLIDGYRTRFEAMQSAQVKEAQARRTIEWPAGDSEFVSTASRPKPIPHEQLQAARRELVDSAYGFLLRCYRAGLLDEEAFRKAAASAGTSVDPADIAK